jgi:phosphoribosylformylglycinamidine (FGAM) synthase PurS component
MKEALKKLENGEIKVVRNEKYNSLRYELCEVREREVKKMLRELIASLENNYDYHDETKQILITGCRIMQR